MGLKKVLNKIFTRNSLGDVLAKYASVAGRMKIQLNKT
jgi:hypothetical protein